VGHAWSKGKREQGIALIIAVLLSLLVSALAVAAIDHAGAELSTAGSSRIVTRALHAADGGLQIARNQLVQSPPNLDPIDVTVDAVVVQSRNKDDSTAQSLEQVGLGPVPEGYELNEGSGAAAVNRLFVIPMTSTSGTTRVALEAKLGLLEVGGNAY
jgi:hypothetical protein